MIDNPCVVWLIKGKRVTRVLISLIMSAKKVVELTYELFEVKEKLVESQKRVTKLLQRLAHVEEENTTLTRLLLCRQCKTYVDSKGPGDTIEARACSECIGIS